MIKKSIIPAAFMALIILISGCASAVRHTTSARFAQAGPYTVAILPITWE